MKVGFSGVGNMSTAIINGIIKNGSGSIKSLHAFSPSGPKADNPMHAKLQWHKSTLEMAEIVDVLILGVKPQVVPKVLQDMRSAKALPLVVSLAAGVTTDTIKKNLAPYTSEPAVIRTMPNTPSAVNAGMTGLFAAQNVSKDHKDFTQALFSSVGQVLWLSDENKFHALTAMSGSGPAYFFQFTDAMIKAGMAQGLSEPEARTLAVQTAKGAGLLMAETGKDPAQLQKEVTSPNGTTFAATEVFRNGNIHGLVGTAIQAASDRSIALSKSE